MFCFECPMFPCVKTVRLEKRYTSRYATSLIDNLLQIKQLGIEKFVAKENEKSKCPKCGGTVSIHDGKCYGCGVLQKTEKK
jgi:ribosomal protein S27AE